MIAYCRLYQPNKSSRVDASDDDTTLDATIQQSPLFIFFVVGEVFSPLLSSWFSAAFPSFLLRYLSRDEDTAFFLIYRQFVFLCVTFSGAMRGEMRGEKRALGTQKNPKNPLWLRVRFNKWMIKRESYCLLMQFYQA
jgi:hypothetical protein